MVESHSLNGSLAVVMICFSLWISNGMTETARCPTSTTLLMFAKTSMPCVKGHAEIYFAKANSTVYGI